ncbi:tetratricopeptide repeat protein [Billgrantia azerbaijanica]|nr:tetratricopeptide repeat protein [Halomonas azerbaijanica]
MRYLLGALLLLGTLQSAAARTLQSDLTERLQSEPLGEVYQWLLSQPQPQPLDDAARYHRWLGQMAMQLGDHATAAEHFETAVLAYPRDLGSRLELAKAYAELGNAPAARASLRALYAYLGEEPLPPAAAEEIARLKRRLESGGVEETRYWWSPVQGTLAIAQGYDSNANLGSQHRTIPLDLFGEFPDEALLADDSRAQASHYTRFDLQASLPLSASFGSAGEAWQLLGGVSAQRYHDLDTLHRWDAYLGGQWQPEPRRQQLSVLLQQQHVQGIGELWYLDADYRRLLDTHWMAELGAQWQHEPAGRRSYRLSAGLWREWRRALFWGRASWQFRPQRPAGDTWRLRLGVQSPAWSWRRLAVSGYAHFEERQDTDTYSYVFFGDVNRRETTTALGARARLPLTESLDLAIDGRWERTRASLELFENRRWTLEAAVQWHW